MLVRYFSSAAAGLAVTTFLLWSMQLLIDYAEPAETGSRPRHELGFVRVPPVEVVETLREKPPVIPDPVEPPRQRAPVDPTAGVISIGMPQAPAAPPAPRWTGTTIHYSDGALVNIVNVQPEYPVRASQRGLEGYVIVRFDVTAAGTVDNVTVVESSNPVFEDAAIKAAARARYKPQIVDGQPRASHGLQKLFRFEMEGQVPASLR